MTVSEALKLFGPAIGAFAAAWFGATLGFRQKRKERALDRVVEWHEKTIQLLARYEEKLVKVHAFSRHALIVVPMQNNTGGAPMAQTIRIPAALWQDLKDAEEPARAALRLADTYTDLRTQLACGAALRNSVNVGAAEWLDMQPEPEIRWAGLASKAVDIASLRDQIQRSLKRVLELDGFLASAWPAFGRWMQIRRIKAEQRRLMRGTA